MKVLLIADVYKHGVAGEVVEVADGFARNWLIPQKLAVKATPSALKEAEELRAQSEFRRAQLDQRLNDLARQIDGIELVFGRRASPTGKLFGSVTTTEIAEALHGKTGIDINRRRISQTALREIGTHEVPVRLGSEISPHLKITIVREEELANFLRAREAEAAAAAEAGTEAADEGGEGVVAGAAQAIGTAAHGVVEAVEHAAEAVTGAVENVAETVAGIATQAVDAVRSVLPGGKDDDSAKETDEKA